MPPAAPTTKIHRWVLAIAMAIPLLAAVSPRDLWAPDEPWYGRIAYEMVRGGDWLVPHWNGSFDAEKPPLGYWIMALAGKATGEVGPLEARLPCALFAALAMLAIARLGRRWFGDPSLGATAALLFSTSAVVVWNSSRAALDLPMTACCLLAAEAGTALVARPSVRSALAAGAALGAGILFKGPHALYVPISAVVGGCVAARCLRRMLDPRWLVALLAMLLVVAAWLVPALVLGGEEYRDRLLGQLASRVKGVGEPHVHAFPYLIGLVFVLGLPWTPLWVAGVVNAFRLRTADPRERFGLGAALGGTLLPLLLLSIAASKRELYLIQFLPCLALLAAHALHRPWGGRISFVSSRLLLGALAVGLVAVAASPFVAPHVWKGGEEGVGPSILTTGTGPATVVLMALIVAAALAVAWRGRRDAATVVRAGAAAVGLAWAAAAIGILPAVEPVKTWDRGVEVIRREAPGVPVVVVGDQDSALVWALRPEIVPTKKPDEGGPAALIESLFADGAPPVVAAVNGKDWVAARTARPDLLTRVSVVWEGAVGSKRFALLVRAAAK